ncbi:hypothetical protein L248_2376 [Schleiferilactobacillus shenzhenensis LY-73]|uniref:Uncharacterized protein n=1 Tax=Schleiferilactobacillus shenzhenensis LY-73 TaxID=1231336 RepID=U4TQG9_9LACO|nr:hypothetical protein L248_2376 [Schleiferilactobacillus shenzhenensis LY-73]
MIISAFRGYWILPQSAKMGQDSAAAVDPESYWILPQSAKMGR